MSGYLSFSQLLIKLGRAERKRLKSRPEGDAPDDRIALLREKMDDGDYMAEAIESMAAGMAAEIERRKE